MIEKLWLTFLCTLFALRHHREHRPLKVKSEYLNLLTCLLSFTSSLPLIDFFPS
jgi:hypothetical protein